jgi:hypothetical protein
MTVTAVEITSRRGSTATANQSTPRTAEPSGVVIVANVETLNAGNQRGCGNDNPYN